MSRWRTWMWATALAVVLGWLVPSAALADDCAWPFDCHPIARAAAAAAAAAGAMAWKWFGGDYYYGTDRPWVDPKHPAEAEAARRRGINIPPPFKDEHGNPTVYARDTNGKVMPYYRLKDPDGNYIFSHSDQASVMDRFAKKIDKIADAVGGRDKKGSVPAGSIESGRL